MILDYILCYGTAFCLGMLSMCFVLYFISQRRLRIKELAKQRKNQLERDMNRSKSWKPQGN